MVEPQPSSSDLEYSSDTNQTNFTWEEPLFEQRSVPKPPPSAVPVEAKKPWFKKPLILALLGLGVVLLVLVILTLVMGPRVAPMLEASPSPSPIISPVSDPLRQRIQKLKVDLDAADPTKQDLPFPPVTMDLKLVELK